MSKSGSEVTKVARLVVARAAARLGLRFYPGDAFSMDGCAVAGARLGFARLNAAELEQAVERLRRAFDR